MSSPYVSSQHYRHTVESETAAIDALADVTPLNRSELKDCFAKGAVWVTLGRRKPARLRRVKKHLHPGDVIELYYQPEVLGQSAPEPTLILDREAYSVWYKPRGMLSQGSKWGDHTALYRWVEMHYQPDAESGLPSQPRQCWIVHRLDRATAGLQILAHSKKMAKTLSALFEHHAIQKSYQAVVHGVFGCNGRTFEAPVDGKTAITHAQAMQQDRTHHLSRLQIELETGRKHQIRRHLSEAGFPIVGDRLYGDERRDSILTEQLKLAHRPDLQLIAWRLRFTCPLTKEALDLTLDDTLLALLPVLE